MCCRIILLVLFTLLSACSLFSSSEPKDGSDSPTENETQPSTGNEPTEVSTTTGKQSSRSEEDLYTSGRDLFEAEMYTIAKDTFFSLRDGYPFGAYAFFAELKAADCSYMLRDYGDAGKLYEEFVKNHPGSPDVSYAQLMAAKSFVKTNKGVGRNRAPLEHALVLLDAAIKNSPDSPYIADLNSERATVMERLQEHEQLIVDFYEKKDNKEAAVARANLLKERFAKVGSSPHDNASDNGEELTPLGISVPEREIETAISSEERHAEEAVSHGIKVLSLSCEKEEQGFILLELSKIDEQMKNALDGIEFRSEDGNITIDIPGLESKSLNTSCFDGENLMLSQNGALTLKSDATLLGVTLLEPPRVLFVLEE